ncbi:MAG: ECF-type sigma factor [Fuerstiella sp.]
MSCDEITELLQRVCQGRDEQATHKLWQAYYHRLQEVARRRLKDFPCRVADEEDVAQSAMNSFFKAAENRRLSPVQNREDLWKLLLTITIRKVNRHKERAMAQKRGADLAAGESGFARGNGNDPINLAGVPDDRFVDTLMLECQELIETLPGTSLPQIALLRMEGHSVEEIAQLQNVAVSTIKRKLARIRTIWSTWLSEN